MSQIQLPKITPFLWFENQAEAAAAYYVSIFENSRIVDTMGGGREGGGRKVMSVTFDLAGQRLIALNGGPHYQLTPAFSLFVSVETQAELDRLWDALLAGGGKTSRCGWLVDRFGLSWQIIPTVLGKLISDPDAGRSSRAVQAMMGMVKLDIAELERAAAG